MPRFQIWVSVALKHSKFWSIGTCDLDFLAEDDSVTESLEPLSEVNMSVLRKMLTVGKKIRLSGFIISVNEAKNGPILMDVMIVE